MDETLSLPGGYRLAGKERQDKTDGPVASFDGYVRQQGNKLLLHTTLALRKRVYEASDWDNFRHAVQMAKSYGNYILITQ